MWKGCDTASCMRQSFSIIHNTSNVPPQKVRTASVHPHQDRYMILRGGSTNGQGACSERLVPVRQTNAQSCG